MNEISRLRWQCRRGMKELDVLLERFLQEHFSHAPATEQQAFADLLCLPDPVLLSYIMGRELPGNQEQRRVIASLRRTSRT
ncbi:MAG: succinate dehydrogenase assembly factor 2 [Gammaproteobacteria bacterium]|nr:succinate dehydrogenase assembly factor 2 [Gammaproteobacteria bacterium]MDE2023252.1 succinate dehydrogenase assembly factor 2 [Gammaproteobacteria bacterium]MDE2272650.1 succinate dehydrogenase assembly factor 2 [Gammaproteobacteria bacterium]